MTTRSEWIARLYEPMDRAVDEVYAAYPKQSLEWLVGAVITYLSGKGSPSYVAERLQKRMKEGI